MPNEQNSSSSSLSSYMSEPPTGARATQGPIPFPEESPFLSDHGLGNAASPPGPRFPVEPPSDLSQFPPSPPPGAASTQPILSGARAAASQAVPRVVPGAVHAGAEPGPALVLHDSISSFPAFLAGDDPYTNSARGSGAVPAPGSPNNELLERLRSVLVTTTDSLQGRLVEQYFGFVSAEAVVPTDSFLEGAERTGRFARYKTSQHKMKALHQLVLAELKLEADKLGANAVLGTQLNVSMDHGVVVFLATGTAVRVG
jgi:uncharacterized protein YbjQ (UPF0145 family)